MVSDNATRIHKLGTTDRHAYFQDQAPLSRTVKAAPALVKGLPLLLPVGSEARSRVLATSSTFFLSHSGPAGVPDETPSLGVDDLEFLPEQGAPPVQYGRCALVGNARSLLGSTNGEEIDAHDAVMRINQAITTGFEEQVGNKTTMRLVNRKWAAAYKKSFSLQLEKNCTLMCSRTTWETYLQVARSIRQRRPDVTMQLVSREVVDSSGMVLRELKDRVEKVRGVPYLGKASPSSGFVGVYLLLQMCDKVSVYGVGDGMAGSWHYFEGRAFAQSREFGNDPHHSFELEHDMLQVLDEGNFITHNLIAHENATFALQRATAEQVTTLKVEASIAEKERARERWEKERARVRELGSMATFTRNIPWQHEEQERRMEHDPRDRYREVGVIC